MLLEILSKLLSESLLSLYPIFVKYINISLGLQVWSRFFSYFIISAFFVDWPFIMKQLFSKSGLALAIVSIIHVYVSYRGFQILESGIAYILFYTYPLMILLFAGIPFNPILLLALVGVYLLSQENIENYEETKVESDKNNEKKIFHKKNVQEYFSYEGVLMVSLAALTEAFIYFIVRDIKTTNNWNHIFISYTLGAILSSIYFFNEIVKLEIKGSLSASLIINLIIGLFGYLLRFFAISNLETTLYAFLSYFGIFMAFVYGVLINNDSLTISKIIGSIFILMPNIYLLISTK
jgi:drug/metabolite transporter (DMT)-like permease